MRDGERIDGLALGRLDEREHVYVGDVGAAVEESESVAALFGETEASGDRERAGRPSAFREAVGDLSESVDGEASPFADLVQEARAARRPDGRGDIADLLGGGPLINEGD